jgi:hypothetical protein
VLRIFLIFLLPSLAGTRLRAGENPPGRPPKKSYFGVPTLGNAPETGPYFGLVGYRLWQPSSDSGARAAYLKTEGTLTLKRQFMAGFEVNLTDSAGRWLWMGRNAWMRFPEYYWGTGLQPDENKVLYDGFRLEFENMLLRRHKKFCYAGLVQQFQSVYGIRFPDGPARFPEIGRGISSGLGLALLCDSRRNPLHPEAGEYFLRLDWVEFHRVLGSGSRFAAIGADARAYRKWGSHGLLALHTMASFRPGLLPFRMYSLMGGPVIQRGYYQGRFRDPNIWAIQAEWRQKIKGIFGWTAFVSTGTVFRKGENWQGTGLKTTGGAGLRIAVIPGEKTNMRFDFAFTQDGDFGFYVGFGEAF